MILKYRTSIARHVAKWDIAGGGSDLPDKVSRGMGYRGDSIAILCDMGPLGVLGQGKSIKLSTSTVAALFSILFPSQVRESLW